MRGEEKHEQKMRSVCHHHTTAVPFGLRDPFLQADGAGQDTIEKPSRMAPLFAEDAVIEGMGILFVTEASADDVAELEPLVAVALALPIALMEERMALA